VLTADPVGHGFPIRGPRATPDPAVCVMRPAAIFVNCVYAYYRKHTIISAVMRTTCYHFYKSNQPAVSVVGLFQKKGWTPMIYNMLSWSNVISRIPIIVMFVIADKQTIDDTRFVLVLMFPHSDLLPNASCRIVTYVTLQEINISILLHLVGFLLTL